MYNTRNLITKVRRKAGIPDNQTTFSDEDILEIADEQIRSKLAPPIVGTREDFFVVSKEVPVTNESVTIPSNALGSRLREVYLMYDNNQRDLTRIDPSDIEYDATSDEVDGFYILGDQISLYPVPTQFDGTLRIEYYARPSKLVVPTNTAVVTGVSGSTLTVSHLPASFQLNTNVDTTSSEGLNSLKVQDVEIESIDRQALTLSLVGSPSVAVGDIISLTGESSVIQFIPEDCNTWLEHLVIAQIHRTQGDYEAEKSTMEEAKMLKEDCLDLLGPRVSNAAQVLLSNKWRRY